MFVKAGNDCNLDITIVYKMLNNSDQIITNIKDIDKDFIKSVENGTAEIEYMLAITNIDNKAIYYVSSCSMFSPEYGIIQKKLYKQFNVDLS